MDGGDLQNVVVRTETETAQVARAGAPMSNDVCASAADDKTCIICMSDPRGVRWSPCGHANSCEACALKLIQHALRKRLQCPECKQTVERLESQSIAQSEVPIARQPSFTSLADQPSSSSSKLLTVDEYLEAELKSADPDRAALAKEAKTHWNDVPSPGEMPWPAALSGGAGLMLPLRPWPFARTVTIVLSIGLMVGYVWGCTTVFFAADEFDDYLATQERWDVKVTQVDGFEGPVTALIPHGRRCGVTFAQCVRALPDPTKHQRWWGLVPNEEVGVVREGIEGLRRARRWLFYLTLFTGSSAVSQPLLSAWRNKPQMLGELSAAGVHSMAGMALMASLYGMFWDSEHNLVIINYVPGAGYVWFILWMLLVCLLFMGAVVKKNFATWACFLVSAAYCLFWLMIPIIGYTWFFAWKYVDTIARQQEDIEHGELRHMPFSGKAAANLGPPFSVCAYLGFSCWVGAFLVSLLAYARHLALLQTDAPYRQAVFVDAMRTQARQGTPQGQQMLTLMAIREVQRQGERRQAAAAARAGSAELV